MADGIFAVVAQQVGIAITGKAARPFRQGHQPAADLARLRHLVGADRRLVIGHAEMLAPVLGRQVERHAGGQGIVDHSLVDALGVQVDLDRPSRAGDTAEDRLPEIVTALLDAALAMDAQADRRYRRQLFQQQGQGVAAIGGMGLGRQAFDHRHAR